MAQIKTFRDLHVWQKSHQLALSIYDITKSFPTEEKFGLVTQMRRAAVSIASNIVEGFRRKSLKDTINFYNMADSSLEELKYQLLLCYDLKFVNQEDYSSVYALSEEVSKMLFSWISLHKAKLTSRTLA